MAMTRIRDHKAEYGRRLERGRARGLSATQYRGHARANEPSLKAKPVKSDERLEKALRELRRTNNQAVAAKEAGVSPERFRRFLREQKLAERKGRAWEITDTRPREHRGGGCDHGWTLSCNPGCAGDRQAGQRHRSRDPSGRREGACRLLQRKARIRGVLARHRHGRRARRVHP
jgi:hypothetical protein